MGDISEHLSRSEFACRCGCGFEVADIKLVQILESTASHFFESAIRASSLQGTPKPTRIRIIINSANRCPSYDREIKAKAARARGERPPPWTGKSQHLQALAADFKMDLVMEGGQKLKIKDDLIADYLISQNVARFGIGRYDGRTHFDVRSNGPARWDKREG